MFPFSGHLRRIRAGFLPACYRCGSRRIDLAHLAPCQRTPHAWLEIVEIDRADTGANQTHDFVPDSLHHAANLPIAPLVDREFDNPASTFLSAPDLAYLRGGRRFAAPDVQAPRQGLQVVISERPVDRDQIGFAHRLRRMRDAVHEIAVVGQQDQPLGIGVQATGGYQSCAVDLDQIGDFERRVPVGNRGDIADRFVQGDIKARLLDRQRATIDGDLLGIGINQRP